MKRIKTLILSLLILPATMVFAGSLQVQYVNSLPEGCRQIGEIQVGDSAWGRSQADVIQALKTEATALGANYLLIDLKRVNHPKQGVYFYGWGTAGVCK